MAWQDSDSDLDDREFPDEDFDDEETVPCPHCRQPVYEDAKRCPNCHRYLSREVTPRRHPWWVVAGALACLGAIGWGLLTFGF